VLRKLTLIVLASSAALAAHGCDDLHDFKTSRATVYRGEVVGSDSAPDQSSFIRKGFPSHTRMELEFDPEATGSNVDSDDDRGSAGRIHTFTCPADNSECEAEDGRSGPFDHARLEPIENLAHDALSEYTFPGFGRLRSYIFSVRFDTKPAEGAAIRRDAMVFLSLMDTGKIEVRAIAASVLAEDGQSDRFPPLFGVFILDRQSR
jgi:hypothetical protein